MRAKEQDRGWLDAKTTVSEGKRILTSSTAPAFLVIDGLQPIGVISAARLRTASNSVRRTVGDVMDYELVAVDRADDVVETMRAFEKAGWASLRRRRPFARPGPRVAASAPG
jgi:predicted transcriptional regulator